MYDEVSTRTFRGKKGCLNSMGLCMAAPWCMLCSLIILGWNEKEAFCDSRVILQGKANVREVGCDAPTVSNGELTMFSCHIDPFGQTRSVGGTSSFASQTYTGICLNTVSAMYQCVEHQERTTKDGKQVVRYTYGKDWIHHQLNSTFFLTRARNYSAWHKCSQDRAFNNPSWPADVPEHDVTTYVAKSVRMGAFTVTEPLVPRVPCNKDFFIYPAPAGWNVSTESGNQYRGPQEKGTLQHEGLKFSPDTEKTVGDMRLGFKTNSWEPEATLYTILGLNNGGSMGTWTAPSTWLCPDFRLHEVFPGKLTKEQLFEKLEKGRGGSTWAFRMLGFCLLWCSLVCLLGPLQVATDWMPFIGDCLGYVAEKVICVISCPPALCLCMGVMAIVWVALRPVLGIFLLIIFSFGMACNGWLGRNARDLRKQGYTGEDSMRDDGQLDPERYENRGTMIDELERGNLDSE